MRDSAIRVNNISKLYRIGKNGFTYDNLRDYLSSKIIFTKAKSRYIPESYSAKKVWALKNVSFEVKHGEILGIIGRNGAGKSTLLKILSGITVPTEGSAEINGRIASLLEIGIGFHEELTGRENIYLNGVILGMKKREIDGKFDQIVRFAEIERFLDTPVKRYSSGMYVRLAFAVAAHIESEILLVDEVLAVGDTEFQSRCLQKMEEVAGAGRTVMFVSHNLVAIQNLCTHAILLDKGIIKDSGSVENVIEAYFTSISKLVEFPLSERTDRQGSGRLRFTGIKFLVNHKETKQFCSGDDVVIEIEYRADEEFVPKNIIFYLAVKTKTGIHLSLCQSNLAISRIDKISKGGKLRCTLFTLPLAHGSYSVNVGCEDSGEMIDWVQDASIFEVMHGRFYVTGNMPAHSPVLLKQQWEVVV